MSDLQLDLSDLECLGKDFNIDIIYIPHKLYTDIFTQTRYTLIVYGTLDYIVDTSNGSVIVKPWISKEFLYTDKKLTKQEVLDIIQKKKHNKEFNNKLENILND